MNIEKTLTFWIICIEHVEWVYVKLLMMRDAIEIFLYIRGQGCKLLTIYRRT